MLVHTIEEVRQQIKKWRAEGLTIGLVPTMGALHSGHKSLFDESVKKCDKTVISIFVNPIQFCPGEDFEKYPRTLENDCSIAKSAGVDLVFAPNAKEMYPDAQMMTGDFLTYVVPPFFKVNMLCGKSRIGHFDGVCTVVNKLFNIVQPDWAFFGEKDYQQFVIIKKMVNDLNIPVKIQGCPLIREESGLAISSRNKYLNDSEKGDALALFNILTNIKRCYNSGITDINALKETAYGFLNEKHSLEYLEFRDNDTLEAKTVADDNTRVLIALKLGEVRLIDNMLIK